MMTPIPLLFIAIIGAVVGGEFNPAPEDEPLYSSEMEDWSTDYDSLNDTNSYDETSYDLFARSASRGIERPECYFEEYTGACCIQAGMHGQNLRTCIELAVQLSEMKASVVVHVNNKEILNKSVDKGKVCANLPPPMPPTKVCLNTYYGAASWSQKTIDTCGAIELGNLVHLRFDCLRFANGKFEHHADIKPENYGLLNVYWQNGRPQFQVVSQPIPENVQHWISQQWTKIKNSFRQKSKKFINWLSRRG